MIKNVCLSGILLCLVACQAGGGGSLNPNLDLSSQIGPVSTGPKPGIGPVSTGPKPLSASTEKVISYFTTLSQSETATSKLQVAFVQKPKTMSSFKPLNLRIKVELEDGTEQVVFDGQISGSGEYLYNTDELKAIVASLQNLENKLVDLDFEISQGNTVKRIEDPVVNACTGNSLFLPLEIEDADSELFEEEDEFEFEEDEGHEMETYYDVAGNRYVQCPEQEDDD